MLEAKTNGKGHNLKKRQHYTCVSIDNLGNVGDAKTKSYFKRAIGYAGA